MRYIIALLIFAVSPAWAQDGFVTTNKPRVAASCSPDTLKGRWRLYMDGPTFCTLDIKRDGTIKKTHNATTKCKGDIRAHILGGTLTLNPPLDGGINQCWVTGHISTKKGRIEIFEAFVTASGDQFTGLFTDFLSPFAGRFTAIKY